MIAEPQEAGFYWVGLGGRWGVVRWTPNWGWNAIGVASTFDHAELQSQPGFVLGPKLDEPTDTIRKEET